MQRIKIAGYSITAILFIGLAWVRLFNYPGGSAGLVVDASLALILLGIGHQVIITAIALLADLYYFAAGFIKYKSKFSRKFYFPFQMLAVGMVLVGAGLLSPSNGVDAAVSGKPLEMLIRAAVILFAVIFIYLITRKLKAFPLSVVRYPFLAICFLLSIPFNK